MSIERTGQWLGHRHVDLDVFCQREDTRQEVPNLSCASVQYNILDAFQLDMVVGLAEMLTPKDICAGITLRIS